MKDVGQLLTWETHDSRVLNAYADVDGTHVRPGLVGEGEEARPGARPWQIERDHYGLMVYTTGVKYDDQERRSLGMKMLADGLGRQQPDGSFSGEDAHHSAAFYLEALARVLILTEQRNEPDLDRCREGLRAGLEWFHRRGSWNDDWWRDTFHHRFFLNAAALFLGWQVLGPTKASVLEQAYAWMAEGIRRQEPDGAITEHGGTDTGYQSLSITFMAGVLMLCELHGPFRDKLAESLDRATTWLLDRIGGGGVIDASGNTRMTATSGERDRVSGQLKGTKSYETAFALYGAGLVRDNSAARDCATAVLATCSVT